MKITVQLQKEGQALLLPIQEAKIKSYLRSFAGSLEFTAFCSEALVENGETVLFTVDDRLLFRGRVFSVKGDGQQVEVLCYDDKRYLLYRDSKVFSAQPLNQYVEAILRERELPVGTLQGGSSLIPSCVYDGKTLLFMIESALDAAEARGEYFAFYSREGALCLSDRRSLVLSQPLTDREIFSLESSKNIDKNTFNQVRLTRHQSKSGRRDHFVAEDTASVKKWGKLSYYASALQKDSDGYLRALAQSLLQEKNKEQKSVRVEAVGDPLLFAGASVRINSEKNGIDKTFWITEMTHIFRDGEHSMEFLGEEWDS